MALIRVAILGALIGRVSAPALAQEHAHQAPERLGTVQFPTSCSPAVAGLFNRGVALLHSFEFGASIRAFEDVLKADSTCAMAHWGIALSRWTNPVAASRRGPALLRQGKAAVDAATRLGARASQRERDYISAVSQLYRDFERTDQRARVLAYERAMRDLVTRHPNDAEARIFHALSLSASALPTDKTYARQLEAGRILEDIWAKQPEHPGLAHYIIHAYDYPALAKQAGDAARKYADIAPSAAHAQHMPSHTFTRVGMWEQSVSANQRSRDIAVRDGSIAEALHASDYLTYAYLQLGREADAKAVLDGLPMLEARFDPNAITGAAPGWAGVFALAAMPARWALERRAWSEAAALVPRSTPVPFADAMTHFARALGAVHTRDLSKARASLDSLAAIHRRLTANGDTYWAEQVAIQRLGAQGWLAFAEGREADALAHMREAVAREDATEKDAVTPGPLAPARELLGDLLLALKRPAEANVEYRATLLKEPNRRLARRGLQESSQARTYRSPGGTTLRVLLDDTNVGPEATVGELTFQPNTDSGDHAHGAIEMFYVLSGELEHVVNGKSERLTSGMVGFVRPPDMVRHKTGPSGAKALVIWVPGDEVKRIVARWTREP
jgi:quercetin dioxygenase-like cupin family protein